MHRQATGPASCCRLPQILAAAAWLPLLLVQHPRCLLLLR